MQSPEAWEGQALLDLGSVWPDTASGSFSDGGLLPAAGQSPSQMPTLAQLSVYSELGAADDSKHPDQLA